MTKKLYIFDFDGTITTKDSLFEFLKFSHGKTYYINILVLTPILVLYLLKLISNEKAKEILFSKFYKNKTAKEFTLLCERFAEKIDNFVNPEIKKKLSKITSEKLNVIIISASIQNWIQPWALKNKIHTVIGTEIEIKNGIITGKFLSKNCYGAEKVNRLNEYFNKTGERRNNYFITSFGDSKGDYNLLSYSDEAFLVKKTQLIKYEKN